MEKEGKGTLRTSHVVSDLSDRTSSYAWLISGSERMSAACGMLKYGVSMRRREIKWNEFCED